MGALGVLSLSFLTALSAAAARGDFTAEPPPGWRDVTASKTGQDVLIAFKGPETSSFVLSRVGPVSLGNAGLVRAMLTDVLAALNRKTRLGLTLSSAVSVASYDNGLSARYIRADYKGRPRLIVALVQYEQTTMLATLISSIPDTLLPSLLGSIKPTGAGAPPPSGQQAVSSDGQLAFSLPAGFSARAVSERERKLGFVLAVRGLDSEMMIQKLADDATPIKEQPQIVKDTVLSVGGVDPATLSELSLRQTPPGPDIILAWARVKDAGGAAQFAAGYLPWCYWGYSVLAKGPRAVDLMAESFKTLALGSSALPRLVAETPKVPVPRELGIRNHFPYATLALGTLVLLAALWKWRARRGSPGPARPGGT